MDYPWYSFIRLPGFLVPGPALLAAALALFFAAALPETAAAQQNTVACPVSDPDAPVLREEDSSSTADIEIDADDLDICPEVSDPPRGQTTYGIRADHDGDGDIDIDAEDVDITATGSPSNAFSNNWGIRADHDGEGDIDIDAIRVNILTLGASSGGIDAIHQGTDGDVSVTVQDGSVETRGERSMGVFAYSHHNTAKSDVTVSVSGTDIDTKGSGSSGVEATHRNENGEGDVTVTVSGADIATEGYSAVGVFGKNFADGKLTVDVSGTDIETKHQPGTGNSWSHGIRADHKGDGDIDLDVTGGSIETKGTNARGIMGWHRGTGDVDVDADGVDIDTSGANAFGIYGLHTKASGTGGIDIGLSDSASVATTGSGAHGIYALHVSGKGTIAVTAGAGSSATAAGAGASGVRIGRFNATTNALERAAEIGGDGYRKQTVTVYGSVAGGSGEAAGIYLAGGGKAVLGRASTVRASSGIAIYAARKLLTESAPKLHVSLNLGGRRVGAVLGGDWIINDGGETTIVVNGVKLHDGATGATGNTAVNGAWNVTIRNDGQTVDRTDPGNWTISGRSESTIQDRDFSAADFTETERTAASLTDPAQAASASGGATGRGGSGGDTAFVRAGALVALLALMSPSPFDPGPGPSEAGTAPRPAFVQSRDGETRHWMRDLSAQPSAAHGAAGAEFGLDAGLGGGFWLGFAAAPDMAAKRADGDASVSGGRYGLRGGWRNEALFAGLSASRADWKAETAFTTPVGGLVAGAFDARQTDLRLGAGGRLGLGGGFSLMPKAEVFDGRLEQDAYRAEGAAFRADMPEMTQRYRGWKAGLGLASGWRDAPRGVKMRPMLNLSALRTETRSDSFTLTQSDRLGIVETSVRARMAGAPKSVLGMAAGVEAAGSGGLRMNFGYAAMESSGGGIHHALAARLQLRF